MALDGEDLEAMAATLEASGRYRVLRKLTEPPAVAAAADAPRRLGLFVDVETTGLDPARDEIIELAMIPFVYGLDGQVQAVQPAFQAFRQPSKPIPPEITAITGITDAMVEGAVLDLARVAAVVDSAQLVVAHNAAFDRRFLERLSPVFVTKPWACSMTQVDWAGEGHEGAKLAYLALGSGFFYDRHRAEHDCAAGIRLLSGASRRSGRPVLADLLDRARRPSWRIWAEGSPFELKDQLKARGYRWNGEGGAGPKAWWIEVEDEAREAELAFLETEIYQRPVELLTRRLTAFERFSDRG